MILNDYDIISRNIEYWRYYYRCRRLFFNTVTNTIYNNKLIYNSDSMDFIQSYDIFCKEVCYEKL